MNPPKQHAKREEGMALLVSVIFLIVMGLSAAYIITRTITHNDQVNHHISHLDAFQGLEAANAAAVVQIARANDNSFPPEERDGFVGIDPDYDFATLGLPDFGSPGVVPVALASRPDVEFFAYPLDWANDGIDNNGDGLIDDVMEQLGFSSVIAHARVVRNGQTVVSRRSEQIIGAGMAISIWQNAIFAGSGQGGGLINGNVAIHGSVHLLGDNLDSNDEAVATIEALELSGTSLIHNNYDGMPADLQWRVPPLPKTMVGGELVDTLFANLRVKNGQVGMNGNSEIGQLNVVGNGMKELMDGVYVTDGWTGNQIVDGDPKHVYSDNGWENPYDLGEGIPFPTYQNDGGRVHIDYYLETDPNPSQGLQEIYGGDLTIKPGSGSFYWNATTGTEVVNQNPGNGGMPQKASLNPDEFYVWFDDTTDTLVINGRIPVDGDINILAGSGNSNKTINYEGKGTMLAFDSSGNGDASVELSTNLVTTGFPHTNLIGLHAEKDFKLGTNSQINIMGGFYAQQSIIVDKQTNIVGTIVGDYFDMGGQVPSIFQVPALEAAWEDYMRMIGADPTNVPQPLAWMEFNVL